MGLSRVWKKGITMTEKRKPGRPKGIPRATKYGEPSVLKTHRLTPTLHEFICKNRAKLEALARDKSG